MFNEPELQRQQTRRQLELLRRQRRNLDAKHQRLRAKLRDIAAAKQRVRTAIWKLENPDKTGKQKARQREKPLQEAPIAPIPEPQAPIQPPPTASTPDHWADYWKGKIKLPPKAPAEPQDVDKS